LLDKNEINQFLQNLGVFPNDSHLNDLMYYLDANDNSKIETREFA